METVIFRGLKDNRADKGFGVMGQEMSDVVINVRDGSEGSVKGVSIDVNCNANT